MVMIEKMVSGRRKTVRRDAETVNTENLPDKGNECEGMSVIFSIVKPNSFLDYLS